MLIFYFVTLTFVFEMLLFIPKQFPGCFGEPGLPVLCVAVTHEVSLNKTCLELFARLFPNE